MIGDSPQEKCIDRLENELNATKLQVQCLREALDTIGFYCAGNELTAAQSNAVMEHVLKALKSIPSLSHFVRREIADELAQQLKNHLRFNNDDAISMNLAIDALTKYHQTKESK